MMILKKEIKIKTIFHIGDIHIRRRERHEEYKKVFKRLSRKLLQENNLHESLIVCTGDIFHDGMSPESIILTKDFFQSLSQISDVIVFRGNHDQTSRSNQEAIDYLASNLYKLETKSNNVFLLEKSGLYEYGNIIFGYTDIYDNEVIKIENNDSKIKIGLWHGTMNKSKTCLGEILEGKFNCNDFSNYDYVLLGDIHKFQYLNKEKTIAYCGSLIQQNFGEDTSHGYIKWDLETKTSEFIKVKNSYQFVTINVKNNVLQDNYTYPEKTYLRIKYSNSDIKILMEIMAEISKKTEIINWKYEDETCIDIFKYETKIENNATHQELKENNTVATDRLISYISENYNLSEGDFANISEKIKEKIKSINYDYEIDKREIKLLSLEFSNFNSYGENNYINFADMKGIMNVCGMNAVGKSSLIMCIYYSIWGYAEDGNIGKFDYVNKKTRNMETIIKFKVNNIEYKIHRKGWFKDAKKDTSHFTHNIVIYKDEIDISGKSLKDIENQILEIVGEQEEFKKSCIMDQKKNESFIDLPDLEKTKKICNILKLDIYTLLQNMLIQEEFVNNKKIKENEKKLFTLNQTTNFDTDLEEKYENLEKEENIIEINKNAKKKEEIFLEIKIEELKNKNTNINEIKMFDIIKKNIDNYKGNLQILYSKKAEIENNKSQDKYKNIENANLEYISELESEIKNLLKKYKVTNTNFTELLQEINFLKTEIEKNAKIIDISFGKADYDKYILNKNEFELLSQKEKKLLETVENIYINIDIAEIEKIKKIKNKFDLEKTEKIDELNRERKNLLKLGYVFENIDINILQEELAIKKGKLIKCRNYKHLDANIGKYNLLESKKKMLLEKLNENKLKLETNNYHLNMLKDYKYNEKCEICMSNNQTQFLVNIKKEIESIQNNILQYEKEINILNNKIDKFSKYIYAKTKLDMNISIQGEIDILASKIDFYYKYKENYDSLEKVMITNCDIYDNYIKVKDKLEIYRNIKIKKEQLDFVDGEKYAVAYENMVNYQNILSEKNNDLENVKLEEIIKNKEAELLSIKTGIFELYEEYKCLCKEDVNIIGEIKKNEEELKILENKFEEIGMIILDNKNLEIYSEDIKLVKKELNEIILNLEKIKKNKNILKEEIIVKNNNSKIFGDLLLETEELKKNGEINKKIIDIIKDGFVDNFLTKNIIPKLTNNLNSILNYYVKFEIMIAYNNKKLTIYKKDKDGTITNSHKMSGYETLMTNIAFRLALNNINKLFKTDFFVIDEAFAFCDDDSISKMQNLFEYMKYLYKYIIVISHNEQIKSYADRDINIINCDGFSKINNNNNNNKEVIDIDDNKKKEKAKIRKKEWNEKNKEKVSIYNKKKYEEKKLK